MRRAVARRARLRIALAVPMLALSLLAPRTTHAADLLTIAVSATPLSLPLYVAQDQGYFEAEGLDVRLTDCVGGSNCLRRLTDRRADLATASEMPVAFHSFERLELAVIATLATTGSNLKIVARSHAAELATPADWTGKRIGTVIGSAAHYFLDLHLLAINVDPRRISVLGMEPGELNGALRDGRVDAIAIWEPFAYLATRAPDPVGVVLPRATAYVQTFNLVARRAPSGERDGLHARLIAAVERGERFIHDRPDDAQAILRRRLQLDAGFVASFWPSTSFRLSLDQALLRTMESEARWAIREGHVKARTAPNFLKTLHVAPLALAKPTAVSLAR